MYVFTEQHMVCGWCNFKWHTQSDICGTVAGTFSWTFGYRLMFNEPLHVWIVWWAWNRIWNKPQSLSKCAWLPRAAVSLRKSLSAAHEKLLHMHKCSFYYTALMPLSIADYQLAAFINVGIPECFLGITAFMILFYCLLVLFVQW